jgi:hypothetical protein
MTPSEFLAARKRVALNQKEAAELGEVCWFTICRYENNKLSSAMRAKTAKGLRQVYDAMLKLPAREPKRVGRPTGPAKAPRVSKKSKLARKPQADNFVEDDMTMKSAPSHRRGYVPARDPLAYRGANDPARLRKMVESFLRQNSIGIVERDHLAFFVLPSDKILELCQKAMLSVAKVRE